MGTNIAFTFDESVTVCGGIAVCGGVTLFGGIIFPYLKMTLPF